MAKQRAKTSKSAKSAMKPAAGMHRMPDGSMMSDKQMKAQMKAMIKGRTKTKMKKGMMK